MPFLGSETGKDGAWQSEDMEVVARLGGITPHFFAEEGLFCSRRNQVIVIPDLADPRPEPVAQIPQTVWDRLAGIRLADRILKRSITIVHPAGDGYLVAAGGRWWLADRSGDARPAGVPAATWPLQRGLCSGTDGRTYLAEYRGNPERSPIRIFVTEDGVRFDTAWIFPAGSVRHVHALVSDPWRPGRIWVLTGDRDHESRFYWTDDGFRTLETFLSAGQISRGVDLILSGDELIWGMDSPVEPSYLCRLPRTGEGDVVRERRLEGPAYYAARNQAGGVYVGTTVEKGPAVLDRLGRIIGLRPSGAWEDLCRNSKDMLPQHGIYYLPRGVLPENFVVFSQRALTPFEGWMTIARDRAWDTRSRSAVLGTGVRGESAAAPSDTGSR